MAYTEQDVRNIINSVESKYPTLPKGTLLKIHGIETAGDANKVNVNGGASKSGAGAKGWFQFTDASAKLFGVDQTDLRSSADGAARHILDGMKRYGGNLELALVDYNGGPKAVKAYQSGKGFPESVGYIQKFYGKQPAEPVGQPTQSNFMKAKESLQTSQAIMGQFQPPEVIPDSNRTIELADAAALESKKAIAAEQQRNTAQEVIDYGMSQTLTAAMQDAFRPSDPTWKFSDTQAKQAVAAGVANDMRFMTYVEAATSQDDFDDRMEKVQGWMEIERKMNNESGIEFLGSQGLMMLGNMADPAAVAASVVAGAGLYAAGVRATTVAGRAAFGVAEGFVSNAAVDAAIQTQTRTEVNLGDVIQQGIVGAGFSALGTVASTTARTIGNVRKMRALGDEVSATALEADAADMDAASKPLQSVTERRTTEALTGAPEAALHAPERVPDAATAPALRPIGETARGEMNPQIRAIQREKAGTIGVEMSAEAAEVTRWAYEDQPDLGKAHEEMQARLEKFYDARDATLSAAHGDVWKKTDSIGLTLARSTSPVVRKLASVLVESATGLGRPEPSVALAADQFNMNLQHKYVPNIISSMVQAMTPAEKAGFYTGWGVKGQNRIGREVAIYREAKRQAMLKGEDMAKFQHPASPEVQRVGDALDAMGMDIRDMMEAAGHPDAAELRGALATGYRQYQWNWRQLQAMIHDADPDFNNFTRAIQAEFREQVVNPALATFRENDLPTLVGAYRKKLEGNIETLQGRIAELEQPRRAMDAATDAVRETTQAVRDIRDQQARIRDAIKELEAKYKAVEPEAKPDTKPETKQAVPDDTPSEAELAVEALTDPAELPLDAPTVLAMSTSELQTQLRANLVKKYGGGNSSTTTAGDALRIMLDSKPAMLSPVHQQFARWLLQSPGLDELPILFSVRPGRSKYMFGADMIIMQPYEALSDNSKMSVKRGPQYWLQNMHAMGQGEVAIVLHETVHARTSLILDRVADGTLTDPTLVAASKRISELRSIMIDRFPKRKRSEGLDYALSNDHEFIAQIMNSREVREAMHSVEVEGKSVWRSMVEAIVQLLGFDKKSTVLTETLDAMDQLLSSNAVLQLKGETGGRRMAAKAKRLTMSQEDRLKVQELRQKIKELEATAKERINLRDEATAAKKSIAGENAQKVKQLRMQLGRFQQQLAEFQVPNGSAVQMKKLYDKFEGDLMAKANSQASHYVRNIIQDADARRDSSMLHLADIAADLLRENHMGDPVTTDMLTVFNQRLQEVIQDRTRREMNLLRPVGDKLLLDFMANNDPVGQAKSLATNTSRKAAMAKFGRITNDFEIQGALEAARLDGASPEEMIALRDTFDILTGKHDQSDPALVQAMKDLTHAAYMGGQGFANLSDVSAMFGSLGLTGGIKAMGSTIRQLIHHGGDTPLMQQLVEVAAGTMGMDHRLNYVLPESDVTGAVDPADAGRLGRVARRASQATSFLSLANRTNSAMHRAFTPQLAEHLTREVLKGAEDARLTNLGLDPNWIDRVKTMLEKHDSARKTGDRINWDSWEDQAAAERMISAIHKGTYQTVQKALLGERPAWAELTVLGRLAGQFRSFGLTASEKQTARGMVGIQDAAVLQQAMMGLVWGGALMYARAHLQTLGMSESERRKYLEKRLSGAEAIAGVLNFWNVSGLATDVGGAVMAMTGATPARGSGIAALDWAGRAVRAPGKLAEGDLAGGARGVVPLGNTIPMLMLLNLAQE